MPRISLEFANGFYESASKPLSYQRCINFIPVIPQAQALNQKALLGRPGLAEFSSNDLSGTNRGSILANNVPYFVNGTKLYSMDSSGVETSLGTISGSNRVSMATNTTVDGVTTICIVVPGGSGYVFKAPANTLTQITDPDYIASDTVTFYGGYYVFTPTNGLNYFISNLNDPLTFDALDTGTAEIDPDLIVTTHVNHGELAVIGERTVEFHKSVGGSDFPIQRISGAILQKGCYAKHTVIDFDNSFVFVAAADTAIIGIRS